MPRATRAAMFTLYFIVFVDLFQVSFVFPLLPKIVENFGGGATEIGVLGSACAAAEGIAAPWLGSLADRVGRRPLLLLAMAGGTTSSALIGFVQSYYLLILARVCEGICGATGGVVAAYIADVTTEEERPRYMSYFQGALFAGLIVGPLVGGLVNNLVGYQAACLSAAALCAVNLLLTFVCLPDSRNFRDQAALVQSQESSGGVNVESSPAQEGQRSLPLGAWVICIASFLDNIGSTAWETTGLLFMQQIFFDNNKDAATLFYTQLVAGVGVVGFVTSMFIYERMQTRMGLKGTIAFGGTLAACGFVCMALPVGAGTQYGKWWFFWSIQFLVFGAIVAGTSISTIITCVVHPSIYGKAIGIQTSFGNVAKAFGPVVFGPIYENMSKTFPWYSCAVAKIIATCMCLAVRVQATSSTQNIEAVSDIVVGSVMAPVTIPRQFSRQTSSVAKDGDARTPTFTRSMTAGVPVATPMFDVPSFPRASTDIGKV